MLKQRIITALILLPLVLWGLFGLAAEHFAYFVALVIGLGAWEWARLAGFQAQPVRIAYAFGLVVLTTLISGSLATAVLYLSLIWWCLATALVLSYPASAKFWSAQWVRLIIGVLTLVPLSEALIVIRTADITVLESLNVLWVLLYVLVIVWGADTGAYFAGKAFGKRKLAPAVSPGKSWAGVWGGAAATTLIALAVALALSFNFVQVVQLILVTILVTAVSVVGDLTESMFKREAGIKDSSQLLPGHGGVLDRIDSLNAAVPVFTCCLLALGWLS